MAKKFWFFILIALTVIVFSKVQVVLAANNTGTGYEIQINIPELKLYLLKDGQEFKIYNIAPGKSVSQTPLGEFTIIHKAVNPVWYPPNGGKPVPPGKTNPLGKFWLGLSIKGYGIHGTKNERSIGHLASMGCVRLHNKNIAELFSYVPIGTTVKIVYQRVKIKIDPSTNKPLLAIFPDVYHRETISIETVKEMLSELNFQGELNEKSLLKQISDASGTYNNVPIKTIIIVNSTQIDEDILEEKGKIFLPLRSIAQQLNLEVVWDQVSKTSSVNGVQLKGVTFEDRFYVSARELADAAGYSVNWDAKNRILSINP